MAAPCTDRHHSRLRFGLRGLTAAAILLTGAMAIPRADAHAPAHVDIAGPIATFRQIPFDPRQPDRTRFGALQWRGGLVLSGKVKDFGGISGLRTVAGGGRFVAVTDQGNWLTGELQYSGGQLVGVDGLALAPIRGAPGQQLSGKRQRDAEGLALLPSGAALVSFERDHRIARYDLPSAGLKARARYLARLPEYDDMSANKGLEALGVLPPGAAREGAVVVFAERFLDANGNHRGWLIDGEKATPLRLVRSDGFDITDLDVLPDGALVVLERRYSPLFGPAMRIRRIAAGELTGETPMRGEILLEAGVTLSIDNMEAISVHLTEDGEVRLTVASDDNFSERQRTLLLQFALIDEGLEKAD